jgi:hypothetical protein
LFGR